MIDTLRDLGRLSADRDVDTARVSVETLRGAVVSDFEDRVAHDLRNVRVRSGGDLAGYVNLTGGDQCLDGHAGARVLGEQRVEDRVADRVTDLVRVPLGYGLAGE